MEHAWVRIGTHESRKRRGRRGLRTPCDSTVGMLEVVQAGTRPTLDESFARGLHDCCVRHGVTELARSVGADENPLVRLVVVRDANGVLLGGGRVHDRHAGKGFPAESMLRHFPQLRTRVRSFSPRLSL